MKNYRRWTSRAALLAAFGFLASSPVAVAPAKAIAQSQCTPLPPACQKANDDGIAIMNSLQSKMSTAGTYEPALAAACGQMIVAQISKVCAEEMQSIGKNDCAQQAFQQEQASKDAAAQNASVAAQVSAGGDGWKDVCSVAR